MFDRCYYPCLGQLEGRPYATIICAGSDGENAQRQLDRIATGWRLRRVADRVIVNTAAQTPEAILAPKSIAPDRLAEARDLGAALAEGIVAGIFLKKGICCDPLGWEADVADPPDRKSTRLNSSH